MLTRTAAVAGEALGQLALKGTTPITNPEIEGDDNINSANLILAGTKDIVYRCSSHFNGKNWHSRLGRNSNYTV